MQYMTLGKTGYRVSRLGFGAMRLPMIKIGGADYVDVEQAIPLFHRAFEAGVSYVDTGFMYCSEESERVVGDAIRSWDRPNEIIVTAKATKFRMSAPGDLRRMLEHSLWKQRRESFDIYCFHGIGYDNWHEIDARTGWIADMLRAKEEGLVKHIGFSFHDKPEGMVRLVDEGIFELVTCQYNYLDRANEQVIHYAHEHGLGVVIMGPVGGGRLAMAPKRLRESGALAGRNPAELALRFVLAHPGVSVALSGMGSLAMLEGNCAAVEAGPLNADEVAAINALMEESKALAKLYCTGCGYCQPCPNAVNIPRNFELYNYHQVYGLEEYAVAEYRELVQAKGDASHCVRCNECLDRCPQHIPIPDQLEQVAALFGPC